MQFDQLRAVTRTLRFRLMLVNALVVLLASMGTLFVLRAGMRFALLHELDQILSEDLVEVELALAAVDEVNSAELLEQLERKARGHIQHQWFVHLDLMPTRNSTVLPADGSQHPDSADALRNGWHNVNAPPAIKDVTLVLGQPTTIAGYRVHGKLCVTRSKQPVQVRVGALLSLIDRDLALIDRIIGLALVLGLIAAPLGGYFLAGLATRPLASIIHTADRLRPEKLNERLPVRGTGDELDQLSLSFNRLLDRIAAFLERNSDFLANAAHELRTPLAALRSTAEVALRSERSVPEYQDLLGTIIDEGESLELLVNQLLLLAETEAAHDALVARGEVVDFGALVEKSCDMFAGVAESRLLELRCRTTPQVLVKGNRHHLRQVLNNLIDNAVKFTPAGGHIEVLLETEPSHDTARLTVRDSGIGIAHEDQSRLFERFFRSERSHRRDVPTRGTGLGLSICEAVVKGHGGTIEVSSELGIGSQFVVTLPMYHADAISK